MMKNILFAIVTIMICSLSFGQSFEGKLTYKVEFDIKAQKIGTFEITKEKVMKKMKKEGQFFDTVTVTIKGGNYIKENNSSLEQKSIYISESNKIYSFQKDIDSPVITDANKYNTYGIQIKAPEVIKIDSTKIINGNECKLIKLSWGNMGEEDYYYTSKVAKIDSKLFSKHNFEYLNLILENTNSYPLEIFKKVNNFVSVKMTLVNISEEAINNGLFDVETITKQNVEKSQNKTTTWKSFEDTSVGYKLEYPENWIAKGSKGGFMCGEQGGLINAEFTIWWSKTKDKERIGFLFNEDGLYDDYEVVEKLITINGISGVYKLRTHKDKPNEYHESIVLKTKKVWYSISNAGTQNPWFEHFYNSFELIK